MSTSYDPAPPTTATGEEGPRHFDLSDPDPPGGNGTAGLSTLEALRSAAETAEQIADVEFADHPLYSPGGVIRVTCSTELEHPEWKRIQMRALPPDQRRKRNPDLRKLNEAEALAGLIAHLATSVAIRQDAGDYKTVEERGHVFTFADAELLAVFGAAEQAVAVRKIFGGYDAYVIDAGKDLLDACGYGDRRPGEEDEETDPR